MNFLKKSGRLSSAGPEILAFVSHCSANFQPILDFFIPNFKLKYEDSGNIKYKLTSNQTSGVFMGHLVDVGLNSHYCSY